MIKNYVTSLMLLFTMGVFSQEIISFETSESYTLGTINNQQGWEVTYQVTDDGDVYFQNQIVTDEEASDGTHSFKNSYESDFAAQFFPLFGAVYVFNNPQSYDNFTISYDVLVTESDGSNFELGIFGYDAEDVYVPVAGVAMNYTGSIYTFDDVNYGKFYIEDASWTPNTWLNVKVEITSTELKYYLDDVLVHTRSNFAMVDIVSFDIVHDNYGGDAYYDNFSIESGTLHIDDTMETAGFQVYPNPVEDRLNVKGVDNSELSKLSVFSLKGEKLLEVNSLDSLNVRSLARGVYVLTIETDNGQTYNEKLIKK